MNRGPHVVRIRREHRELASLRGFTLIELLIVMAIILLLAGLVLAASGWVQKKGARSRVDAEIAALSAAVINYKADNGMYPRDANTDALNARTSNDPAAYKSASYLLYNELAGVTAGSRTPTAGKKSYFLFKPNMLSPSDQSLAVTAVRDPFGNSYGYSTAYASDLEQVPPIDPPTHGYNPTFDLWSTCGTTGAASTDTAQWLKNW